METNVRLLEDRVQKAVQRLKDLGVERERLAEEVRELRRKLGEAESRREKLAARPQASGEVVAAIRQAIQELRES